MVRALIILCMLVCARAVSAQQTLNIHTKSNGVISMPFSMKPDMSFAKGNIMTITSTEKTIEYPFSDVEKVTFDDAESDEPDLKSFSVTYIIDGEVYKKETQLQGSTLFPLEVSSKEGYTFSGWSEIPSIMPDHDLTVTGSFIPNKYMLTYMLNGEIYQSYEVTFGDAIVAEAEPVKDGHIFSGWSMIPATMPAKDVIVTGNFTQGQYKLLYMVDGQLYKTIAMNFGSLITAEEAPEKEGYTFSGWSKIPASMPAKDVTVSGSFSINNYVLTYLLDGEMYKTYELAYETLIIPEPDPVKEGYIFNGWSEIPASMPAMDVTVTGSFTYVDAIKDLMANRDDYQIYTIDGKPAGTLQKGLNIIRLKNGVVMKVMVK